MGMATAFSAGGGFRGHALFRRPSLFVPFVISKETARRGLQTGLGALCIRAVDELRTATGSDQRGNRRGHPRGGGHSCDQDGCSGDCPLAIQHSLKNHEGKGVELAGGPDQPDGG